MSTTDLLRNSIIDKLLTITNKDYLSDLYRVISTNSVDQDIVQLSDEQIKMLNLSDEDIIYERLIPHNQLDKDDLRWLKGQ